MNSVLVILMLGANSEYTISKDDIINNMFLVIAANAFGLPVINTIFDPDYLKYIFRKYLAKKLSEENRITQ